MNLKSIVIVVSFACFLFRIAFANASPPLANARDDVSSGTAKGLKCNLLSGNVAPEEVGLSSWCGTGNPHPIDVELHQQRYKEDVGTVDIRAAQGRAHTAWDNELKSLYAQLDVLLDRKNRHLLQKSQQAWERYADADGEWLWSSVMVSTCYGGTLGGVRISDRHLEMKRQRACDLYLFFQSINQGGN